MAIAPASVGKFPISNHFWKELCDCCVAGSEGKSCHLVTPLIGAPDDLDMELPDSPRWSENQ